MTRMIRRAKRVLGDKEMHLGILVETAFVLALLGAGSLICALFSLG
jgi:hypothetical protein